MPKPYKTSCIDYRKSGYLSRYDCIFECNIDYYRKEFNKRPASRQTEDINIELLMMEEKNKTFNSLTGRECENVCGTNPDCYKEYFTFEDHRMHLKKCFEIMINPPFHANLLILHSPKIEFKELLCYIMGIIGLWFGFSFIMFNDFFLIIYKFTVGFINKYKSKILLISNKL
jgi:hypothetical protein